MATHWGNAGSTGLPTGSLSTSYKTIADALEWGPGKIRPSSDTISAMLSWMVQEGMIELAPLPKSNPRRTIITICNWDLYEANQDGQSALPAALPNPPPADPQPGGDMFGKPPPAPTKGKRKPGTRPKQQYVASPQAVRCLRAWEKHRPLPTKPGGELLCPRDIYHRVFDRMHTLDKVPWDDLQGVPGIFSRCAWAVKSWTEGMIQSPSKMRTKSDKYPEKMEHEVMATQILSQGKKPEGDRAVYRFPNQEWRKQ